MHCSKLATTADELRRFYPRAAAARREEGLTCPLPTSTMADSLTLSRTSLAGDSAAWLHVNLVNLFN